ncbi:MAG: twin-arginine translocase TatA/TatE family subunit [Kiritimatiellae bacterium]|nr:twin-arginine translocase TatA/TatE family subunit [Kiritimatiellia bacterium]
MGRLGPQELIIILFIVILLFGAKKLPDLARSLGQSIKEFSKAKEEGFRAIAEADADKPKEEKKENEQAKS